MKIKRDAIAVAITGHAPKGLIHYIDIFAAREREMFDKRLWLEKLLYLQIVSPIKGSSFVWLNIKHFGVCKSFVLFKSFHETTGAAPTSEQNRLIVYCI